MDDRPEWDLPVVLARMPDVWAALLEVHADNGSGWCRGCRSPVGPAVRWPCTLHAAADRARAIHGRA